MYYRKLHYILLNECLSNTIHIVDEWHWNAYWLMIDNINRLVDQCLLTYLHNVDLILEQILVINNTNIPRLYMSVICSIIACTVIFYWYYIVHSSILKYNIDTQYILLYYIILRPRVHLPQSFNLNWWKKGIHISKKLPHILFHSLVAVPYISYFDKTLVLFNSNVSELPSNLVIFIFVLSEYCKVKISGIDSILRSTDMCILWLCSLFYLSKFQISCLFSILQLLLTIIPTISPYTVSTSSTLNHF